MPWHSGLFTYSATGNPQKEQRMMIVAGHIVAEPEQRAEDVSAETFATGR
jgi:hypothetical protein